jgi:signal transduction histidine kinase
MLDVKNEAGLITVVVSDNGIGIPEERLTEIFEPFHQLDGSTTRRYAGTGLGLSMAQRIIEAHGSQIKVDSVLGEGSRFEFSLPVADQLASEEIERADEL